MNFFKTIQKSEQIKNTSEEKKILIVEDDNLSYSLLEEIFLDYNYIIKRALDGSGAIDFFKEDKYAFDLVLMDLRLPKVDGFKATSKIKEINHSVPVIAVSAYVHTHSIEDSQICGCDDFIAKPFEISHLISVVQKYLTVSN